MVENEVRGWKGGEEEEASRELWMNMSLRKEKE